MMSTPSSDIRSARSQARLRVNQRPPSLKLSGVRLMTPMTSVRPPMGRSRRGSFQKRLFIFNGVEWGRARRLAEKEAHACQRALRLRKLGTVNGAHTVAARRELAGRAREGRAHAQRVPHAQDIRGPRLVCVHGDDPEAAERHGVNPVRVDKYSLVVERRAAGLQVQTVTQPDG